MAGNPMHNKKLYELLGDGTQDAANRWDEVMRSLYGEHGIENQNQLSVKTGISVNTLRSNGAFNTPHSMTFRTFSRICKALGADGVDVWNRFDGYDLTSAKAFDDAYEEAKGRVRELVGRFLSLKPETQVTVLQMVGGISEDDTGDALHMAACEMLGEHLGDVIGRCHSWDYIDLS